MSTVRYFATKNLHSPFVAVIGDWPDRTGLFNGTPFTPAIDTGKALLNWLDAGVAPEEEKENVHKLMADEMIAAIDDCEHIDHLRNWWTKHKGEVTAKDNRKTILQERED